MRHAVAAQGLQLGPTQLHRVVTEHVGQQLVGLRLLPGYVPGEFGFQTTRDSGNDGSYGRLDFKSATNAAMGTMVTVAMVLFLAMASNVFGAVFTKLGSSSLITQLLLAVPLGDWWKLALIMFVFFVLGWPFEWPVIILVFLPIVLPVIEKLELGLNKLDLLIWVGTVLAVNMQTAYLSPPVAMSAYYLRNVVPQWSLTTIYKGMADYMVIQVIVLILLLLYPQIALWLPHAVR